MATRSAPEGELSSSPAAKARRTAGEFSAIDMDVDGEDGDPDEPVYVPHQPGPASAGASTILIENTTVDPSTMLQKAEQAADASVERLKMRTPGIVVGQATIAFWKNKYLKLAINRAVSRAEESAEEGMQTAITLQDPEEILDFDLGFDDSGRSHKFEWTIKAGEHHLQWYLGGGQWGVFDEQRIEAIFAVHAENATITETLRPMRLANQERVGRGARGRVDAAQLQTLRAAAGSSIVRYDGFDAKGLPRVVRVEGGAAASSRRGMRRAFTGYLPSREFVNPKTGQRQTVYPKRYTRDALGNYVWETKEAPQAPETGDVRAVIRPVPLNAHHIEWIWHKWMKNVLPDLPSAIPYWRSKKDKLELTPAAIPLLTRGSINHLGMQVMADTADRADSEDERKLRARLRPLPVQRWLQNNGFAAEGPASLQALLPEAPITALTGRTASLGFADAGGLFKGWRLGATLFDPVNLAEGRWAHGPVSLYAVDEDGQNTAFAWVFNRAEGDAQKDAEDEEERGNNRQAPDSPGSAVRLTGNAVIVITKKSDRPDWMKRLEEFWTEYKRLGEGIKWPALSATEKKWFQDHAKALTADPPEKHLRGGPIPRSIASENTYTDPPPKPDGQALCLLNPYAVSSEARDALMQYVDEFMARQGDEMAKRYTHPSRWYRSVPRSVRPPEYQHFCDPVPLISVHSLRVGQSKSTSGEGNNMPRLTDMRIAAPSADNLVRGRDPEQLISGYSSVYRRTFFAPEPLRGVAMRPDQRELRARLKSDAREARRRCLEDPKTMNHDPIDATAPSNPGIDYETRACLNFELGRGSNLYSDFVAKPDDGPNARNQNAPKVPRAFAGVVTPLYPEVLMRLAKDSFDRSNMALDLLATYASGFLDVEKIEAHFKVGTSATAQALCALSDTQLKNKRETILGWRCQDWTDASYKMPWASSSDTPKLTVWQLLGLEDVPGFNTPAADGNALVAATCIGRVRKAYALRSQIKMHRQSVNALQDQLNALRRGAHYTDDERVGSAPLPRSEARSDAAIRDDEREDPAGVSQEDRDAWARAATSVDGAVSYVRTATDAFKAILARFLQAERQAADDVARQAAENRTKTDGAVVAGLVRLQWLNLKLSKLVDKTLRRSVADADFGWIDPRTVGDAARRFLFEQRAAVSKYARTRLADDRKDVVDVARFCVVGGTEETIDNESRELDPAASGGFYLAVRYDTGVEKHCGGVDTVHPADGTDTSYDMVDVKKARSVHEMLIDPTTPGREGWKERAGAPAWFVQECEHMRKAGLDVEPMLIGRDTRSDNVTRDSSVAWQHFPELQELSADYAANFKFGVLRTQRARCDPRYRWPPLAPPAAEKGELPQSRAAPAALHVRQLDAATLRGLWPFWAKVQLETPAGGSTEKARNGRSEWDYYRHVQTHPILQSAKTPLPPEFAQPLWAEFAPHIKSVKDADFRAAGIAPAQIVYDEGAVDLRGEPGQGTKVCSLFFDDTFRTLEIDDVEAVTVSNNRPCLLWTTEAAAVETAKQAASQPARTVNRWFPHRRDADKPLMVIYPNRLGFYSRADVYVKLARAGSEPPPPLRSMESRLPIRTKEIRTNVVAPLYVTVLDAVDFADAMVMGDLEWIKFCEDQKASNYFKHCEEYKVEAAVGPIVTFSGTREWWQAHRAAFKEFEQVRYDREEKKWLPLSETTRLEQEENAFQSGEAVSADYVLLCERQLELAEQGGTAAVRRFAKETFDEALANLKQQYDDQNGKLHLSRNPDYVGPLEGEAPRKAGTFTSFDAPPPKVLRELERRLEDDGKDRGLAKFATRPAERTLGHWVAERKLFTEAFDAKRGSPEFVALEQLKAKMKNFETAWEDRLQNDALLVSLRAMELSLKRVADGARPDSLAVTLMGAVFNDARYKEEGLQDATHSMPFCHTEVGPGRSVRFHVVKPTDIWPRQQFVERLAQPIFAFADYMGSVRRVAHAIDEMDRMVKSARGEGAGLMNRIQNRIQNRVQLASTNEAASRRLHKEFPRTMRALSSGPEGPPWPTLQRLEELLAPVRAHLRTLWIYFDRVLEQKDKEAIMDTATEYIQKDHDDNKDSDPHCLRATRYATGLGVDFLNARGLVEGYWTETIDPDSALDDIEPFYLYDGDTMSLSRQSTAVVQALLDATLTVALGEHKPNATPWKQIPLDVATRNEFKFFQGLQYRQLSEQQRTQLVKSKLAAADPPREVAEKEIRMIMQRGLHAWAMNDLDLMHSIGGTLVRDPFKLREEVYVENAGAMSAAGGSAAGAAARPPDRWTYLYTRVHLFDRFEQWVANGAPPLETRAEPEASSSTSNPTLAVRSLPALRGKRVAQALQQLDALVGVHGGHSSGLAAAVWGALTARPSTNVARVAQSDDDDPREFYPSNLNEKEENALAASGKSYATNAFGSAIRSNTLRDLTSRFVDVYENKPVQIAADSTSGAGDRTRRAAGSMPTSVLKPHQDRPDFVDAVLAVEAQRRLGQEAAVRATLTRARGAIARLGAEAGRARAAAAAAGRRRGGGGERRRPRAGGRRGVLEAGARRAAGRPRDYQCGGGKQRQGRRLGRQAQGRAEAVCRHGPAKRRSASGQRPKAD